MTTPTPPHPPTSTSGTLLLSGKPKPWLSTEPKPWQNKDAPAFEPVVKIVESKRPASSPRKGVAEEDYVVFSCVGAEIVVPESIARVSNLVCCFSPNFPTRINLSQGMLHSRF